MEVNVSNNISLYDVNLTANTCTSCAQQRAFNIHTIYTPKTVLELCVGPSLPILERYYNSYNINVIGNDIDKKYLKQSPNMIIGDCFTINYSKSNVVVFAPPLSKGCSGKREDSLSIEQVTPSYYDFLKIRNSKCVLVLPGRSKATKRDRVQFYKLICYLHSNSIDFIVTPLVDRVVKYYDVYIL